MWYNKLSESEWSEFLLASRADDYCNELWEKYQKREISYEKVCDYEYVFWKAYERDKRLQKLGI